MQQLLGSPSYKRTLLNAKVEMSLVVMSCANSAAPIVVLLSTGEVAGKNRPLKVLKSTAAPTGLLLASVKKNQKPQGICMRRPVRTTGARKLCQLPWTLSANSDRIAWSLNWPAPVV